MPIVVESVSLVKFLSWLQEQSIGLFVCAGMSHNRYFRGLAAIAPSLPSKICFPQLFRDYSEYLKISVVLV